MSAQVIVAFLFFAVSMTITPGAGNLTLLGISNRFGFSAALPFVAGTTFGVLIVFAGTSAGLMSILTSVPELYSAIKYLGALYLLYIAWGIFTFKMEEETTSESSAGFISGTLIQVLNPKAWIAAMTVFSQFVEASGNYLVQVVTIITAFLLVTTLSTTIWAYFGSLLKRLLHSPNQMVVVNRCLGATLAMTVVFMLTQTS
ncbi:LysE family translocator [Vibrio hannami]|uniref:LysE family translocator n=1 Tax=Vibrio hannami TaxID=2717094 RepID=UPI00241070ED|nr:LysE family translocator [Vibrio hannami]MDG3087906.1 LysE family translocator [Vibrio hannami]